MWRAVGARATARSGGVWASMDGLPGLEELFVRYFPPAQTQRCQRSPIRKSSLNGWNTKGGIAHPTGLPNDRANFRFVVDLRFTNDNGQFTTVEADTGTAATTYTDGGVEPETRYAYRIKAVNAHGTSSRSGYVNVETPASPAARFAVVRPRSNWENCRIKSLTNGMPVRTPHHESREQHPGTPFNCLP